MTHRLSASAKSAAEPETADEISVGRMYECGATVKQDYVTALHWYQLAAVTRDSAATAGVHRIEELLDLSHHTPKSS